MLRDVGVELRDGALMFKLIDGSGHGVFSSHSSKNWSSHTRAAPKC